MFPSIHFRPLAIVMLVATTATSCGSSTATPGPRPGSSGTATTEPVQVPPDSPVAQPASESIGDPMDQPAYAESAGDETSTAAGTSARPVPEAKPAAAGPGGRLAGLLAAHNELRERHCAPPMTWSDALAATAQKWADTLRKKGCLFGHDNDTSYGENLAFFRPIGRVDGAGVVAGWYQEVDDYNFKKPGFSMKTGHFTQLVWTTTTELGCGVTSCGEGEIWVCRYNPPGNYRGQYRQHVLPESCTK